MRINIEIDTEHDEINPAILAAMLESVKRCEKEPPRDIIREALAQINPEKLHNTLSSAGFTVFDPQPKFPEFSMMPGGVHTHPGVQNEPLPTGAPQTESPVHGTGEVVSEDTETPALVGSTEPAPKKKGRPPGSKNKTSGETEPAQTAAQPALALPPGIPPNPLGGGTSAAPILSAPPVVLQTPTATALPATSAMPSSTSGAIGIQDLRDVCQAANKKHGGAFAINIMRGTTWPDGSPKSWTCVSLDGIPEAERQAFYNIMAEASL